MPLAASPPRTDPREEVVQRLTALGAVAVLRLDSPRRLVDVVQALRIGGVEAVEVTMTMPDALEGIRLVVREMRESVLVGVGSVLDADTARRALDAGARYVVSPVFKPEVVRAAHEGGAAALPGCFTPTECLAAHEAGADLVKVFPADVLGIPFFKGVLAPMPFLRLMPTGGVTPENAGDWLRAGAAAVGVGGALVPRAAAEAEDWRAITRLAQTLCTSVGAARGAA